MGTGQIYQFGRPVAERQQADMPFDRHAGIVANPLLQARQPIEQGALAGIRRSNNRDAGVGAPAQGYFISGYSDFCGLSHQPLQAKS